jgi:hypothetical protein
MDWILTLIDNLLSALLKFANYPEVKNVFLGIFTFFEKFV